MHIPASAIQTVTLIVMDPSKFNNKPGTAKVGAISNAQKVQNFLKCKRDHLETLKSFAKNQKTRFLNSLTVTKNVKGDPLGFLPSILLQNIET